VTSVTPNNGPAAGGTSVTITGTGFASGSTTVKFGATAGTSVNVTSPTSLTVNVPAGTGTVSVTAITTGGGSSAPLASAYTYNAATSPGGAITLAKSTALVGNYPEAISGTGWTSDTTVTLNQCATTTFSAATCDAANQVTLTLGTGKSAGTFKKVVIDLAVGVIDSHGDTCGVAGSTPCFVVVVGTTADSTSSGALGFSLPSFAAKKTTVLLGNYVDAIKAANFPIGDSIVAQECDASVSVPSTVSTHCDAATQVSGTAGTKGSVTFSPGVALGVGSTYADSSAGTCQIGGTCTIGLTDATNSAIGASVSVGFTSPIVSLKSKTNLVGNALDQVKVAAFPIGDTIVAQECDSTVSIPSTVSTHCDAATQISGPAGSKGSVTFSPAELTLRVGGAYSDSSGGTCPVGGTCDVVVSDSDNPSIGLSVDVTFATPTATLKASSNVKPNFVDKVTAGNFPAGDTVTAQECDANVTSANVATNCDSATQISGTASSKGAVTFTAAGITVLVGSAYSDSAGGTCPAGGSCHIVVNDSSHSGALIVIPVGLAS
jgi:hypothetical protein